LSWRCGADFIQKMDNAEPSQAEKDAARRARRILCWCTAAGIALPVALWLLVR
jgi:hypothetical protein